MDEDALLGGWLGRQHLAAIERAVRDAPEVAPAGAGERVVGGVVAVRPDAELRIVVEIGVGVIIPRPLPGRIAAARDRYAHVIGTPRLAGVRQLRDQPPVGERIVENDAIAVPAFFARAAEAREERPGGDRSEQRPSILCKDCEAGVHDLQVVRRAHVALRIGRDPVDLESPGVHAEEAEPDPVEVGGGLRQQERRDARLEHRIVLRRRCPDLVWNAPGPMLDFLLVLLRRRRGEQREWRGDVVAVRLQDMRARRLRRRQAGHGDEAQQQRSRQAHSGTLGAAFGGGVPHPIGRSENLPVSDADRLCVCVLSGATRRGTPPSPRCWRAGSRRSRTARSCRSPARSRARRCAGTGRRSVPPAARRSPAR